MLSDNFAAFDASDPLPRIPLLLDQIKEVLIDIRGILYHFEEILLSVGEDQEGETEAE